MPAQLPLRFHQRPFKRQFSRHPCSRQELERNSQPVFWSFHRSLYLARCRFSKNGVVWTSAGGQDIVARMWIDCQIDPQPVSLSGIWAANAISFLLNPGAADEIHQAAKANRHGREGIARTGCRLGGHLECAEHQYCCPPAAASKYAALFSYRVVERWSALSAHL